MPARRVPGPTARRAHCWVAWPSLEPSTQSAFHVAFPLPSRSSLMAGAGGRGAFSCMVMRPPPRHRCPLRSLETSLPPRVTCSPAPGGGSAEPGSRSAPLPVAGGRLEPGISRGPLGSGAGVVPTYTCFVPLLPRAGWDVHCELYGVPGCLDAWIASLMPPSRNTPPPSCAPSPPRQGTCSLQCHPPAWTGAQTGAGTWSGS